MCSDYDRSWRRCHAWRGIALIAGGGGDSGGGDSSVGDSDNLDANPFTGTFKLDYEEDDTQILNLRQDGTSITGTFDLTDTNSCCIVIVTANVSGGFLWHSHAAT